ncbi:hypothetical protein [Mesoplasma coleopterae]|uniref:hypothetical protein n=1 Tax=Mesoplasma coleopterae TaxID=324078 RepID=UPI000D02BD42|nr:hypothetical protein [Mesoplasma coleopterae]AVN62997.1 hypothetical protein CG000_01610 [Mesoplasma coleopterae]
MKKLLLSLSATSFAFVAPSSVIFTGNNNIKSDISECALINENESLILNEANENWFSNSWENVGLKHGVNTPATGTHTRIDEKIEQKATAKINWDETIKKATYVSAQGIFELNTSKNPDKKYEIILKKVYSESNSEKVTFEGEIENDQWLGWGHQTSKVTLKMVATYNSSEEITTMLLKSNIYARTAGSVHSCSTISEVNKISFLSGYLQN